MALPLDSIGVLDFTIFMQGPEACKKPAVVGLKEYA